MNLEFLIQPGFIACCYMQGLGMRETLWSCRERHMDKQMTVRQQSGEEHGRGCQMDQGSGPLSATY